MTTDMERLDKIPPILWIVLAVVLLAQALWVFKDATKRGEKRWLWGFFALLSTPGNLLIYLLVTRLIIKSKECVHCGRRISAKAKFCPECGGPQRDAPIQGK